MAGNNFANGKSTRREEMKSWPTGYRGTSSREGTCLGTTYPMQINLSSLDGHRNGVYISSILVKKEKRWSLKYEILRTDRELIGNSKCA
jgi:hypothetical protein